jgi:hypothetical protein
LSNTNHIKTRCALIYSGKLIGSYSTNDIRRVTLVTNPVVSHEWEWNRIVTTRNPLFRSFLVPPPPLIEVHEPRQESERSYICVLGYRFCLFLRFWYLILELFRQFGHFFHFIETIFCFKWQSAFQWILIVFPLCCKLKARRYQRSNMEP